MYLQCTYISVRDEFTVCVPGVVGVVLRRRHMAVVGWVCLLYRCTRVRSACVWGGLGVTTMERPSKRQRFTRASVPVCQPRHEIRRSARLYLLLCSHQLHGVQRVRRRKIQACVRRARLSCMCSRLVFRLRRSHQQRHLQIVSGKLQSHLRIVPGGAFRPAIGNPLHL